MQDQDVFHVILVILFECLIFRRLVNIVQTLQSCNVEMEFLLTIDWL